MKNKILFVIMDGVADIGARTALAEAKKPNLDYLAEHSYCGLWRAKLPPGYNIVSFSDVAILQLLGCYDYPGRGYLEALGIGMKPKKGSICFRANFATTKRNTNSRNLQGKFSYNNSKNPNGFSYVNSKKLFQNFSYNIIDRRAGRDETGLDILSKAINKIKLTSVKGVEAKFYQSVGHRAILILEGKNLAPIADIDNGKVGRLLMPIGRTVAEKRTVLALTEFMDKVYDLLDKHPVNSKSLREPHYKKRKKKANFILLRGAGIVMKVRSFEQRFGLKAAVISGVGITKGIARFLGMDVIDVKGATSHFDTNLDGKIDASLRALNNHDYVVLHVNGADEAGHDRNCKKKKKFIEMVDDSIFSKIIERKELNIVVAGDHITSCKTGQHMAGSVPFLIYNANEESGQLASSLRDSVNISKFDEKHCKKGFITNNPMERILLTVVKPPINKSRR